MFDAPLVNLFSACMQCEVHVLVTCMKGVHSLYPATMTTGTPQAHPSNGNDKGATPGRIVTFTLNEDTLALSRYRSRFFLIYVNGHHVEGGNRIHSSLNVVSWHSNHHSRKGPKVASFWLNNNRGNEDPNDSNHVLYQLLHADPPLIRPTGRKRKEASADNGVSVIDCEEFEVLVPEEGLIRQCHYCQSWEDDEHRYSEIKDDKYWCQKVRATPPLSRFVAN